MRRQKQVMVRVLLAAVLGLTLRQLVPDAAACRGCGDAPAAFLCTVEPALGYCRSCIRNHVDQAHAGTSVGVLELKSGTKVEMKSGFKDPFGDRGRIDFSAFLEESDQ